MALTLGGLLTEARTVLNDVVPVSGVARYSDTDMMSYFNDALLQARSKRPDMFLGMGLRNAVPQYAMPADSGTPFPLDPTYYAAFVFYVIGMCEIREDAFSDDNRAVTLMNKFVSQLIKVAS